jgi:hypothetical protein
LIAIAATLVAGTASASVPLFAAKCQNGITADSTAHCQVYVNGKVAKLINRPDGQITAQPDGVYVDITPQGSEPPRLTATGKDKSFGECEIVSFKAPTAHAFAAASGHRHRSAPAKVALMREARRTARSDQGNRCDSVRPPWPAVPVARRRSW